MNWKDFFKTHQHTIVLSAGYVLVGTLAFGLGRSTAPIVQQASSLHNNYNPNPPSVQSVSKSSDCSGVKGSSSLIYHVPGGAFYNKTTNPIRCFATEAEAKAAGFRRSSR